MIVENQILIELLSDVDNWSDLKVKLEKYNAAETETTTKKTQAGKIFEVFTKYYLQTDPKKTELYKKVWLYDEISIDIKEKLRLPTIDHGIDILLQDFDNNFHAVQCKFKNDESKSLSWSGDKIANVFALGTNCDKIIVFTNASDTTSVAKAFEEKFEQIAFDELNSIEPEIFISIYDLARGNHPKELIKHTPKEHQKNAIEKVVLHFENNSRGQLILPCGAGKTVTALWIKEELKSKTTLVLVPSLALLKQIKNDWARHKSYLYSYLCVCSEKDIDNDQEDSVRLHTYEIGGPVTTDYEKVKVFLLKDGEKVIYSTYQSIEVIINAVKTINDFCFDLVVCDEAHRTAGSKDKNTFTLVHFDKNLPAKKRLYMTATPKIVSKKLKRKLGEDYELFCDMSNSEIFGDEAYHMTFGEAIDKKILVDYKIIGIGVTDRQIKQQIEERRYLGNYTADELANNYALDLVMTNYRAFHSISFHSKVLYAQNFSKMHKDFFEDVYSKSVDGNQTTTLRSKILHEFKESPKGLVSNARCLTEGVDVPSIDMIYFCDPKSSVVDIVQASGRALRLDPNGKKEWGYIVVPIFHHEDQDVELEIKKKPIFQHLIQVIRSLCDHDERLRAEINEIAYKKGKSENSRIKLDFSGSTIENIIKLEGIEEKVRDVLFDEIIEKTSSNWELRFQHLKEYIEKNGHSTISKKDLANSDLYHWVTSLRKTYYEGRLEFAKKKRLNEIKFDWKGENRREINDLDENWKQIYSKLEAYFKQNGNSDVPARYIDKTLGTWAVTQRVKKKGNKLEDWQIELLNKINFNWKPQNQIDDFMEQIQKFKEANGHTRVLQSETNYGLLPRRVNRYRTIHNTGAKDKYGNIVSKHGKLPVEYIKQLDELGFIWWAGHVDWNEKYLELKEFYNKNGHSLVSGLEDQSLYYWSYKQRKNKEILSEEQVDKLKTIDFIFDTSTIDNEDGDDFLDNLIELQKYKEETGGFIFSKYQKEYNSLKIWLAGIRLKFREEKLEKEKIDLMHSIGFTDADFSPVDKKWFTKYEELKFYFEKNHTFSIPSINEYRNLRKWVNYQQTTFRAGTLEDDKLELLKSIGFSFEKNYLDGNNRKGTSNIEIWNNRIVELSEYYQEHKTFHIQSTDRKYNSLLLWLRRIKKENEKGILSPDRINDLENIGFDFSQNGRYINKDSFQKRSEQTWKKRIIELKKYHQENGTYYIPTKDKENKSLLQWIIGIRKKIRTDELSKVKITELQQIGFDLNLNGLRKKSDKIDPRWKVNLELFSTHFKNTKSFNIDPNNPTNNRLINWVRTQRTIYNQGNLNDDKINALEEIGYSLTENNPNKGKQNANKWGFARKWDDMFSQLSDYFQANQSFLIPQSDNLNSKLRAWVQVQRRNYSNNSILKERAEKLISIGFNFNEKYKGKDPHKLARKQKEISSKPAKLINSWNEQYLKLLEFKMKNDHCNISRTTNNPLAFWVSKQRSARRNDELSNEQIIKLDFLGFEWEVARTNNYSDVWLSSYNQLLEVFQTTGSSHIDKEIGNKSLYTWSSRQRSKNRKGKLTKEQIDLLDKIAFTWNPPTFTEGSLLDDDKWFLILQQLAEYKEIYGDCNVSQLNKDYKKLGRWLNDQRLDYSKGKLKQHRKELLEEIGIIWNAKENKFTIKLKMLSEYHQKYGHFNVKSSDTEFLGLYDWLHMMIKKGTTEERKNKLASIGCDISMLITNDL